MIKNQKGITLISVVITVVVLLILGTIVIRESFNLIDSSRTRKYITVMSLVRVEVEKIFENFEFEEDSSNLELADTSILTDIGAENIVLAAGERMPIQDKLSSSEQNLIMKNIELAKDTNADGIQDVDVDKLWYKWSSNVISNLNINYSNIIATGDYFIVNYATGDVLFSRPIKMENGQTSYSLIGLKELDK